MTAPVIRQFVGSIPDKGQAQTTFDTNVDAWLDWTTLQFAPDLLALAPWIEARVLEVAATALSGDLPAIAAQAGNFLRVNAGATAMEFRTPAQLLADVGASTLAGRNLIINGSGRVNQRAYVSAVATTVANQFTLDRWFVITSGQNLTFTGNDADRTMTAPAGGVAQVIEGRNIVGGTYVINWTGTATCTVGGVARLKGATFTLTANTNVTVRFTGGTYTDVQIELGTVATAFERVDIGLELAQCQRYYETGQLFMQTGTTGHYGVGTQFSVPKRATPTMTGAVGSSASTTGTAFQGVLFSGFGINASSSGSGAYVFWTWEATAELTA